MNPTPKIIALSKSETHTLQKFAQAKIELIKGIGVKGDAHSGKKVKHRSRVAQNTNQPNLRQVHLIHSELFDELKIKGFEISPAQMVENITTRNIDLLSLPKDTILKIGTNAEVQITGLRNPCDQLDGIQKGLMKAVLDRDAQGNLIRKAGIMGIVLKTGIIKIDDEIIIEFPTKPFIKLDRV